MSFPTGARLALAFVLGAAALGGCTAIPDHQGYVLDEPLVTAVQPGVDNRDSVLGTLGRATIVGHIDQRDRFYV